MISQGLHQNTMSCKLETAPSAMHAQCINFRSGNDIYNDENGYNDTNVY